MGEMESLQLWQNSLKVATPATPTPGFGSTLSPIRGSPSSRPSFAIRTYGNVRVGQSQRGGRLYVGVHVRHPAGFPQWRTPTVIIKQSNNVTYCARTVTAAK